MNADAVTLEGRLVRLEPLDGRHAEALALAATPELFVYHFPPTEFSAAGFSAQIQALRGRANCCPFAIVLIETDKAIGVTCFLDIRPEHRGLEIGFTWIAKSLHGSLVNPEAKYLLLRHAFEELGALRVQLKMDARNAQSQRAVAKLGAVREGVLRKHMITPDGHLRDTVMYSVVDDDWPRVRELLEKRLGYVP